VGTNDGFKLFVLNTGVFFDSLEIFTRGLSSNNSVYSSGERSSGDIGIDDLKEIWMSMHR